MDIALFIFIFFSHSNITYSIYYQILACQVKSPFKNLKVDVVVISSLYREAFYFHLIRT